MAERRRIKTFIIQNGYRRSKTIEFQETFNLTLVGSPSGILFNIAGSEFKDGEVLQLESGEYPYVAKLPNSTYSERRGTVLIQGSDVVLDVSLTKDAKSTVIKVVNSSGGALADVRVIVNNEVLGTTDTDGKLALSLPSGKMVFVLDKESFRYDPQELVIDGGTVTLTMTAVTDNTVGYLSVIPSEDGAEISINGQVVPGSPYTAALPPGTYPVVVRKYGFREYVTNVIISLQRSTPLFVKMVKYEPTGSVTFSTTGEDGYITLDGQFFGSTPKTLVRTSGVYNWTITRDKFETETGSVVISEGKNSKIQVTLKPILNPPPGTVLVEFKQIGYDWYKTVADGNGGSVDVLVEKNSVRAGFPSTRSLTLFYNVPAVVEIRNSNGDIFREGQTTTRSSSPLLSKSNSLTVDLPTEKTYVIKAVFDPRKAMPSELEAGPYRSSEIYVDFSDRNKAKSPVEQIINLSPFEKKTYWAVYELNMYEEDFSPYISTNGSGFITYNPTSKILEAGALLKAYVGTRENTRGSLTLTIKDDIGNILSSKTLSHSAVAMNTSITHELPKNINSVVFDYARAQRLFIDNTGKGVSEVSWTGASSFTYTCKSWQGASGFLPGNVKIQLAIPFSYKVEQ